MKRVWSLFLVLGLLLSASFAHAETVREQVNAPERITIDFFQTATGLSTFIIDAQVQVPDVDSLNTYEYGTIPVTAEMLRNVADALELDDMTIAPFQKSTTTSVPYPLMISSSAQGDLQLLASNDLYTADCCKGTLQYEDVALQRIEECSAYMCMRLWPCEGKAAPDTEYAFADATALALETVRKFAPDMTLAVSGVLLSYKQLTDAEIRKLNDKTYKGEKPDNCRYGAYGFLFSRVIDGVPITYDESHDGTNPDDSAYIYPMPYERLALAIKDGQIASLKYTSPSVVGARKQEGAPLLPFEQVIGIAQSIFPLKYAGREAYLKNDNTISYVIDSITLGYMRVRISGDPNTFELIPVWDFFGQTVYAPNNNQMRPGTLYRESLLTINAMDGTVIDRDYGY